MITKNSITDSHPEIAKQWHPTLNKGLTPDDFTHGSPKSIWWKCDKGEDHVWQVSISKRTRGNKCPICSGRKIVKSNCLTTTHPEIAKQWHPSLNGDLTPNDIGSGSGKLVWWKCDKGEDHIWKVSPNGRKLNGENPVGCPICSNQKTVLSNSLFTIHPKIAKQWHPTKNGKLTPKDLTSGSNKKVWWKCDKGEDHIWKTTPLSRTSGNTGCPMCCNKALSKTNSLTALYPEIAKEWHPIKNGNLKPQDFISGSNKKVWWKCDKGEDHEWKSVINSRTSRNSGCPFCKNRKISNTNNLEFTHPEIAKEWHPTKNGKLTPQDVTYGSDKIVWWKCEKGEDHIWKTNIYNRLAKGCPVCSNKKVVESNSLFFVNPDLTKEWHPTKNGKLTPKDLTSGSNRKVWWKCDKGEDHEWRSMIAKRESGQGCPICSNKKVVKSNSMAVVSPKLAEEWHPTKNGKLTPYDVVSSTNRKIWWKCDKAEDHIWRVSGNSRINFNSGCPFCTLTPQSRQELIITFELKLFFKNINPKGFKTKLKNRLRAIDIYIPELNLCIEFDGSYWHKDKRDLDKIKSEILLASGYKLIRIREEPLNKIYDTDIISKKPYNGKEITNDILNTILSTFDLKESLVSKIKEYQRKKELQNEKGLERYTNQILKEKALKKLSKN